ncbi:MAG: hypothetical protein NUV77_07060 [Thermoguttaceae bacterium]|nr:hypothetical protein [Thermoguttaceae bacterium]
MPSPEGPTSPEAQPTFGAPGAIGAAPPPVTLPGAPKPPSLASIFGLGGAGASADETHLRLARQLWGPEFLKTIESGLDLASDESLGSAAEQIVLASTVPVDSVRAKLCALLYERADEGPGDLEGAGLTSRYFNDPGFLVVLKALPRKDPPDPNKPVLVRPRLRRSRDRGGSGDSGYGAPGGPGAPGGMPGSAPGSAPGQKTEKTSPDQSAYEWMAASEAMARALCTQFYAAVKGGKSKGSADADPFQLPASMKPSVEYHFAWPDDLPKGKLSGVPMSPMSIHYVRLERKTTPGKVVDFFKRKFPRPVEHVAASGIWMDGVRIDADQGRKQSFDLLITKRAPAAKTGTKARAQPGTPGGSPEMPTMPGGEGAPSYGGPTYGGPGGYPGQPGQPGGSGERLARDVEADLVIELLAVEIKAPDTGLKDAARRKNRPAKADSGDL